MYDDLITLRDPPPNRVGKCTGNQEQHLSEGAAMLAFAMHLLRSVPDLTRVAIHPDGEHGKRFDIKAWLEKHGFTQATTSGKTAYGGTYVSGSGRTVVVHPASGRGDVFAEIGEISFSAECKGGVLNTTHAGQTSRLRQGLCETVGLSLSQEITNGRRQFVVVPRTRTTELLAKRMSSRVSAAGLEIALVDGTGNVHFVTDPRGDPAQS